MCSSSVLEFFKWEVEKRTLASKTLPLAERTAAAAPTEVGSVTSILIGWMLLLFACAAASCAPVKKRRRWGDARRFGLGRPGSSNSSNNNHDDDIEETDDDFEDSKSGNTAKPCKRKQQQPQQRQLPAEPQRYSQVPLMYGVMNQE